MHGAVAEFIGIAGSQESNLDLLRFVEQLFLAVDIDQFDDIFFSDVVYLAAL